MQVEIVTTAIGVISALIALRAQQQARKSAEEAERLAKKQNSIQSQAAMTQKDLMHLEIIGEKLRVTNTTKSPLHDLSISSGALPNGDAKIRRLDKMEHKDLELTSDLLCRYSFTLFELEWKELDDDDNELVRKQSWRSAE